MAVKYQVVQYIEREVTYRDVTIEEIHKMHNTLIEDDEHTPDWIIRDYEETYKKPYPFTPLDFDTFLKEAIDEGDIIVIS